MWQYNYTGYYCDPVYIEHHGVKGQKWGVRRYQNEDGTLTAAGKKQYRKDNRTRRSLMRRTAAAKRTLRKAVADTDSANSDYGTSKSNYKSANSRIAITSRGRANKREAINQAREELDRASERVEKSRAKLRRANRYYNENAEALTKHVNQMVDDFGSNNVKQLRTKQVTYGRDYTRNVIRTGITVADLPLIGQSYVGSRESDYENRVRDERVRENTDSRDKYDY